MFWIENGNGNLWGMPVGGGVSSKLASSLVPGNSQGLAVTRRTSTSRMRREQRRDLQLPSRPGEVLAGADHDLQRHGVGNGGRERGHEPLLHGLRDERLPVRPQHHRSPVRQRVRRRAHAVHGREQRERPSRSPSTRNFIYYSARNQNNCDGVVARMTKGGVADVTYTTKACWPRAIRVATSGLYVFWLEAFAGKSCAARSPAAAPRAPR